MDIGQCCWNLRLRHTKTDQCQPVHYAYYLSAVATIISIDKIYKYTGIDSERHRYINIISTIHLLSSTVYFHIYPAFPFSYASASSCNVVINDRQHHRENKLTVILLLLVDWLLVYWW